MCSERPLDDCCDISNTSNESTVNAPALITQWRRVFATLGPGLIVMLADNDAGSVITMTQSGAQWGYRLLLLQVAIVPLLFMVQELAARLGLASGKGFGELVSQRFGIFLGFISLTTLLASCFGAIVTQMSGLAGIGQLFGIPVWQSISLLVILILAMVYTGSYHSVERIAIFFGLFGLAFLVVAWKAHPDFGQILEQQRHLPISDGRYLYLVAATLGTSIMPWTVFYQQSALVDKGLSIKDLRLARYDIMFGAFVCQLLAAAVLIAAAATLGQHRGGITLETIPQIAIAFQASLGRTIGLSVFALGLSGCAIVATIVICLSAVWAVGEATGARHSLESDPTKSPYFYIVSAGLLVAAGTLVCSGFNLVQLSIATGVINALLLPVVLGFLFRLAQTELPEPYRLKGVYATLVGIVFVITAGIGVYAGVVGVTS